MTSNPVDQAIRARFRRSATPQHQNNKIYNEKGDSNDKKTLSARSYDSADNSSDDHAGSQCRFFSDGKGQLDLKNFYFSRDFRDGFPSQSRRAEWAQGFQLNLRSGYTPGVVGFGLDAVGLLGVKLDSSPARAGTGILPRGEHDASDDFSTLLVTAKAKFRETELRVGALNPGLPLLLSNNTRLFDQYFNGAQITSKDIKDFTFHFGKIDKTKLRDSSGMDPLTTSDHPETSDSYTYGGVDYKVLPNLKVSAHASELKDFYTRHFLGLTSDVPVGPGKAFTDLRYFQARQAGQEIIGKVDNRVVSTNFGYQIAGHIFSGGYQKVMGTLPIFTWAERVPTCSASRWRASSRPKTSVFGIFGMTTILPRWAFRD
ncbi:OprD family outer membrane porin [Pseudomonas sp. RIT409]|uniref:OprD family outer membrane porin n=1 Tax=Pseudomonas sp. RIT409 TaxID=2202159 RepID=UPI002113DEC1|nr:OprD family outer membrane porin [Pseudomonas sp. RIT 409]